MRAQRLTDTPAGPRDHVQHATRNSRLLRQCGDHQRRDRRGRCRFEHQRVAHDQRVSDLPHRHRVRNVPRRDRGADADRFAADHVLAPREDRTRKPYFLFPRKPVRGVPREVAHGVARHPQAAGRPRQRRAVAATVGKRDAARVGLDEIGEVEHDVGTLTRRQIAPHARVEGRARSAHRGIDVVAVAARHLREDLPVARIDDLHRPAATRIDELAADQHLVSVHAHLLAGSSTARNPHQAARSRVEHARSGT